MKYCYGILLQILVCMNVCAQYNIEETSIIIIKQTIFTEACVDSISTKYHVPIQIMSIGCFPFSQKELDEFKNHNEKIELQLEKINGKGWYSKLIAEVNSCEKSLCPYDSIRKYYDPGMTGISLIFPTSTEKILDVHKCILDYTIIPLLIQHDSIAIEITSSSTPDETAFSFNRAQDCLDYLVMNGIDRARISIIDNGNNSRYSLNPLSPWNRRIGFSFIY